MFGWLWDSLTSIIVNPFLKARFYLARPSEPPSPDLKRTKYFAWAFAVYWLSGGIFNLWHEPRTFFPIGAAGLFIVQLLDLAISLTGAIGALGVLRIRDWGRKFLIAACSCSVLLSLTYLPFVFAHSADIEKAVGPQMEELFRLLFHLDPRSAEGAPVFEQFMSGLVVKGMWVIGLLGCAVETATIWYFMRARTKELFRGKVPIVMSDHVDPRKQANYLAINSWIWMLLAGVSIPVILPRSFYPEAMTSIPIVSWRVIFTAVYAASLVAGVYALRRVEAGRRSVIVLAVLNVLTQGVYTIFFDPSKYGDLIPTILYHGYCIWFFSRRKTRAQFARQAS